MAQPQLPPRLKQHSNGVWYIYFTNDAGRSDRVSTRARDLPQAQTVFAGWLREESIDKAADAGSPTIEVLWGRYWDQHVLKKVVDQNRLFYIWKNLEPRFGAMRPEDIDADEIDHYIKLRAGGGVGRAATGPTIRRELGALVACLNWNVRKVTPRHLRLDARTVPYIELPDKSEPRDRVLTKSEIETLLDTRPETDRLGLYFRLLIATGARRGALLELKWEQVDWDNALLRLNPNGRKQTRKRRPIIPMTRGLRALLEREHARQRKKYGDNPVYVMRHPGAIAIQLRRLLDTLGIEGVTSHTFRHTFITHHVQKGTPFPALAAMVGDSEDTLRDNYVHLQPDYLREVAANTMEIHAS